jgi:membrane protease YdiL (CAAX protease family)
MAMAHGDRKRAWQQIGLIYGSALIFVGAVWPAVMHLWVANTWTQALCLIGMALTAYAVVRREGMRAGSVGASVENLWRAAAVLAATYGIFLALLLGLRAMGALEGPLVTSVRWKSWLSNWVFVGGCEEFAFRGCLLVALARLMDRSRFPWRAILLNGLLFALYHLPGELDFVRHGLIQPIDLAVQLAIPFVSTVVLFGPLYVLSGNLWLVALVHGVTDYPILPVIRENPLMGLVFMAIALVLGRFLFPSSTPVIATEL